MIRIISRVWKFLWRFSFFRFGTFHGPVGLLNYSIAFLLISNYGVDKYIAMFTGHIVHVAIGFYYDREVTFRAQNSKHMLCRYWRNDAISISAMYLVVFLLVDHYELHVDLATYMSWSVEWSILAMRAVPAMLIGTAITFGLNKLTTFSEANSQPKL
jgi:putative flippase GtrA